MYFKKEYSELLKKHEDLLERHMKLHKFTMKIMEEQERHDNALTVIFNEVDKE